MSLSMLFDSIVSRSRSHLDLGFCIGPRFLVALVATCLQMIWLYRNMGRSLWGRRVPGPRATTMNRKNSLLFTALAYPRAGMAPGGNMRKWSKVSLTWLHEAGPGTNECDHEWRASGNAVWLRVVNDRGLSAPTWGIQCASL